MRLDKQKFNFNLTSTGENIIRCSQVDEAFFNVFNIVLNEDVAFIKPAETYIDGHPIIKIDVEYGGKQYDNIEFKVVADASAPSQVFINEHALLHGNSVEFQSETLLQEQIAEVEELIEHQDIEECIAFDPVEDWDNLQEQSRANKESKITTFLLQVEQQLLERIDESIAQARQSIAASALGIQNKAESTIQQKVEQSSNEFTSLFEQWKQATEIKISKYTIDAIEKACNHLEDQFEIVVQEQECSTFSHLSEKIFAASIEAKNSLQGDLANKVQEISASLQNTIKDADESLKLHVEQKLQQFNDNIVAESIKNFDDGIAAFFNKQTLWLQEATTGQINEISESAAVRIDEACKTIDGAIENLQGKHGELAQQLKEHAQQTLEQAAAKITTEQIRSVRECVDEVLAEQMQALEVKASDEKIISEARAAQANVFKNALGAIKTEMSNEVKSHVANLQTDLYKKFTVYSQAYAGGGTVAVQYANGGTMNGTLNVATGQILSGGIDLATIFSGGSGPGSEPLFTSWAQTYSANYEGTYNTVLATSANWDYAYSLIQTYSPNWDYAYSIVQANSPSWDSAYSTVLSSSANWNSAYSTVQANSAAWGANHLQTLSFNESNALLTISNGNAVSLSALSGTSVSYLSALIDVSIPTPTNGQVLAYNSVTSKWNADTPTPVVGLYLPLSGGSLTGVLSTNQDIEITDLTKGIILRSPSNLKYRVTVTDAGELVTTLI
jgi:hypothetical protein